VRKNSSGRKTKLAEKQPDFVVRAEWAMRRVARKLRAEHKRLGTPLVVFKD
jgi:hypothetical protein